MQNQHLLVLPAVQKLQLWHHNTIQQEYPIATAANGLGEIKNSGQTPRGWHQIRAKIGKNLPKNTVFVGRRPTGEIYSTTLAAAYPSRDWILTRILWLSGLEIGKNRLGQVDTMQRFIYIHGCPDNSISGIPLSKGCIQMHNEHIIELFDLIEIGTKIHIGEL